MSCRNVLPIISILSVINGTHPTLRGDPHSPGAVIRALSTLGWVIPPDEHDAHELLHVLLSSLEEEIIKPKKVSFRKRFFTTKLIKYILNIISSLAVCLMYWMTLK